MSRNPRILKQAAYSQLAKIFSKAPGYPNTHRLAVTRSDFARTTRHESDIQCVLPDTKRAKIDLIMRDRKTLFENGLGESGFNDALHCAEPSVAANWRPHVSFM